MNEAESASATETAAGAATESAGELLAFDCPRCQEPVQERYWGPCTACRATLRAEQAGQQREVEVAAYEPKMNVTPNQVATKD